ncbi:hypothetical protein GCM10010528_20110 [Gordonia defluvii]|jgi:hypothetical protein|uniref:Heavy metal-binding domain-containing protein n=1 Tax=Gordonia defluvii TaxID=283718 RepID=A0ABP6LHK4_9ACTN
MNTAARLSLFTLGLLGVFGAALLVGRYVVPNQTGSSGHAAHSSSTSTEANSNRGHGNDSADPAMGTTSTVGGYGLTDLRGPSAPGLAAPLSFTVTAGDGEPLSRFTPAHDKELHLIVVRSDGAHYAHLHPTRDGAGTWSTTWRAPAAGSYRVVTDFVPGDRDGDEPVVLSSTVEVAGQFDPSTPTPSRTATVDGFTVTVDGDLGPHGTSMLTARVRHAGQTVRLQPYLGALGHLVVLRAGDLAYTHVHPRQDATAGTDVAFGATAPSTGRYFAYFDFQIDGVVRTAAFVLDTHH